MLDIALITLSVALGLLTIWLATSIEYREQEIHLGTSLAPELDFHSTVHKVPRKTELILEDIKDWFLSALPVIAFLGVFGFAIYLLIKRLLQNGSLILPIILMVTLLLFLFSRGLFAFRYRRNSVDRITGRISKKQKIVKFYGGGRLPQKVYEGDSKNISISLHQILAIEKSDEEPLIIKNSKDGILITLQIVTNENADEFLEFELLAAGFKVEGDRKQKQRLASTNLLYQWNCFFSNSGNHDLAFIIRVHNSKDCIDIGRIESMIKVVKIDHMTQQQVWVWATIAGVVSGGLALAEVLHRLGVW